jgi:hypothetical protein
MEAKFEIIKEKCAVNYEADNYEGEINQKYVKELVKIFMENKLM